MYSYIYFEKFPFFVSKKVDRVELNHFLKIFVHVELWIDTERIKKKELNR